MSQSPFTIGIIQDPADADQAANLARADELVRNAAARGAQIICLKELFNALYFCKTQQCDRFDLAEPIPGPTTNAMQELARELAVVIIVPIFERQAAGIYRNSAAVIDADGTLLGVYRKMHIPDDPLFNEKYYFTPGDGHLDYHGERPGEANGFKVWKTRYATIGVLICWDQWYPEAARITSLLGAEVLFYPTAIGWHPAEKDEWGQAQVEAWRTIQRSHAIANGVYVASPNRDRPRGRTGHERHHVLRSLVRGRSVRPVHRRGGRRRAGADRALRSRADRDGTPELAVHADRRVDAYKPILNRYIGSYGTDVRSFGGARSYMADSSD